MALTKVGRSLLNTGVADSSDATAITISSAEDATFAGHILLADSKNVKIGAGTDLQLYHDGTNSYITNSTGALKIATETSGIAVTIGHTTSETTIADNLTVTGTVAAGVITADGLDMGDSEKIRLGAAQDLEIYHDGSHSYIYDGGTGNIVLKTNNGANVDIMGASEYMAKFIKDGAVELYYNDAKKLETTAAGITVTGAVTGNLTGDVTGNVSGTAATVTTAAQTNITSLGTLTSLGVDGAATFNESGASVDFRVEGDTEQNLFFVDGSADKIGIGTASPNRLVTLYKASAPVLNIKNSDADLHLEQNGQNSYVGNSSTSGFLQLFTNNGNSTVHMLANGNVGIGTSSPSYELHVEDDATETTIAVRSNIGGTGSAIGGRLRLQLGAQSNSGSGNADSQAGDTLGQILFEGQGTDYSYQGGSIKTIVTTGDGDDGRSNQATAMTFDTLAVGSVSPAERMRINATGLMGIGSAPSNLTSEIITITTPDSGGGQGIAFKRLDTNTDQVCGQIRWSNNSTDDLAFIKAKTDGDNTSSALLFFTNTSSASTEVMRINKSGMMSIGDTTGYAGGHDALSRLQLTGGGSVLGIRHSQVTDASHRVVAVFTDNGGTYRGRITINNSATLFTSASDYRLKENVETLPNGLDRLKQLKPVKFKWKEHDYTSEGFIAHEVAEIVPEAVVGEKDDAVMQSMDYGRITPLLVKAIQEQQTIIDDLKSRIKTLEDA